MHPRRLLPDVAALAAGIAVGLLALRVLHHAWQPAWAVACALLGGVLARRGAEAAWREFPAVVRRTFDGAVVLTGTLLACLVTLTLFGLPYLVLRGAEAAGVGAAATVSGLGLVALRWSHGRTAEEFARHRAREAALREAALDARLRALQAQVNPHFLFNALNAVAELAHEDPEAAERVIADLAALMRYALGASAAGDPGSRPQAASATLAQELESVERYLRIERARLGERLRVETRIDPRLQLENVPLPALTLQPLVENAVRHALAPRREGGTIRIEVRALAARSPDEPDVLVAVEDDGDGLPEAQRELVRAGGAAAPRAGGGTAGAGGGLANVVQRLALSQRFRPEGPSLRAATPSSGRGTRLELLLRDAGAPP